MKQRDEYIVDIKMHNLRTVNIVCDATFYGKRKDKLGTLVFELAVQGKAEEFTVVNDEVLTQKFGKSIIEVPFSRYLRHIIA